MSASGAGDDLDRASAPGASACERPASIESLAERVRDRTERGAAIYPRGGSTALDFGGKPSKPGVDFDLLGLNRVVDYPAADMTITVEAGMTLSGLATVLAEHGQRLPLDPPHADRATLGGVFATAACGPRRHGWGRPRDWIIGVSFVTAAGEIVKGGGRVVKNVAGYDFPRLLTGSLGTLGVIAQMTLKVRPRPEDSAFAWGVFERWEDVAAALDRLNTSATRPAAIELLNKPAAEAIGGPIGLPVGPFTLAVGFEGGREAVAWQTAKIREELDSPIIDIITNHSVDQLWSALAEELERGFTGAPMMVINTRRSACAAAAARLDPERYAVQARAGGGVVHAYARAGAEESAFARDVTELRSEATSLGGNLIVARCPDDWKPRIGIWGKLGPEWELSRKIKAALDPQGLMNPGRWTDKM